MARHGFFATNTISDDKAVSEEKERSCTRFSDFMNKIFINALENQKKTTKEKLRYREDGKFFNCFNIWYSHTH